MGILTPQANTTVEPEMQLLLEGTLLTARMTSAYADARLRLIDYFDRLADTLAHFDVAPLAACGVACTGSAYLCGAADEERLMAEASAATGIAVLSAAASVRAALAELGARRIALLSPYPKWLSDVGQRYWRDAGLEIASCAGLAVDLLDTRAIYRLSTRDVLEAFGQLDTRGADAVLLAGTGMPTLRTMAMVMPGIPVLSSNLCLAWDLNRATGGDAALAPWLGAGARWRGRLGARAAA